MKGTRLSSKNLSLASQVKGFSTRSWGERLVLSHVSLNQVKELDSRMDRAKKANLFWERY